MQIIKLLCISSYKESKDIKEIIKDTANKLEDVKYQAIDAIEDIANSEQKKKYSVSYPANDDGLLTNNKNSKD